MKRLIHSSSSILKKYRGIWFGANKNPITVKELLDRIVNLDGRGFTLARKTRHNSDNLLENGQVEIYLMDEERRGSLKLTDEAIDYLISNLDEHNWIRQRLLQWIGEDS